VSRFGAVAAELDHQFFGFPAGEDGVDASRCPGQLVFQHRCVNFEPTAGRRLSRACHATRLANQALALCSKLLPVTKLTRYEGEAMKKSIRPAGAGALASAAMFSVSGCLGGVLGIPATKDKKCAPPAALTNLKPALSSDFNPSGKIGQEVRDGKFAFVVTAIEACQADQGPHEGGKHREQAGIVLPQRTGAVEESVPPNWSNTDRRLGSAAGRGRFR